MTRIYTNVPSMVARANLTSNMSALETALERLSTGFKINSGKDDPAGLIASETLRSDITGIKTAIKNTERANMMIATADSALNEVTSLLNDIRGLVTEAANTGAMSAEMIKANQLQVDASLDAIDRIAAQTTFMGQKLLDGSLDFDTTGVDRNDIQSLAVNQVTFGTDKTPVDVNVSVRRAAEKAALYYNNPALADDIILSWGGNYGYNTQKFERGASVEYIARVINASSSATGVVAEVGQDAQAGILYTSSLGANNDIIIQAGLAGLDSSNIEIKYLRGTSEGIFIDYQESLGDGSPAKILVYLQTEAYDAAFADDVDTSPGVNDNNALKFTASILGEQYNHSSIHYVDAKATQADWAAKAAASGGAAGSYAEYHDEATSATALFGDINGGGTFADSLQVGEYFTIRANAAGAQHNDTQIRFINSPAEIPAGKNALARMSEDGKILNVYVNPDTTTLAQVQEALKIEGTFDLVPSTEDVLTRTLVASDFGAVGSSVLGHTHNSGGDAGTVFIYLDYLATEGGNISANDIVALFDLTQSTSRGSERAASLFDVQRTADNSGEGLIQLFANYGTVPPKTAFSNVFTGGVTGGNVVSTAQEVVTALNNSAFWGMYMCPEMLSTLAVENALGNYYDATDPPIVTSRLAPGNSGIGIVQAFEEVAYYGDPNEGTGLQFLGEKNSPNIRFVAEAGNDQLWVEHTTVPDTVDFANAVLTATNANASLVISAVQKGGDYDDIRFVFKRVGESGATPTPDRKDGWVEYDPGESYAEALMTFKDINGADILNTAFTVTATERGDMYNDVRVTMGLADNQAEDIVISFDESSKQLRVSISSSAIGTVRASDVVAAINKADVKFNAELSYSQQAGNTGAGTFADMGLAVNRFIDVGNTGDSGGHVGGTVTVWLADDAGTGGSPTADDVVQLINNDEVVGKMFVARTYSSGPDAGSGAIDFVNDGPIVTKDGLIEKGVLTVHLVTDKNGLIQTTAKDLVEWWDQQAPETVDNISVSLVRPQGAEWDECNDPYGWGLLAPTTWIEGECDDIIVEDIQFVGWNDDIQKQLYTEKYARGTMTSDNGVNSSYDLVARRSGPDYNGYTIVYINDPNVTGYFADNFVIGSDKNPCDYDPFEMERDDCGELITPQSSSQNGMYLVLDKDTKTITVHVRAGVTTANDIEQLIETDAQTRGLFTVEQLGTGDGVIAMSDDTLLTADGSGPPGELNGAKLLFGSDDDPYKLIFKSMYYGSDQFVDVQATSTSGGSTSFQTQDASGKHAEKVYGSDVEALINGVGAVGSGLDVSLNTSTLSVDFTLSEEAGTTEGYSTDFTITGGGATFQVGPDVVSNQQLTLGIQSVNTVKLGGASGKLFQLRSGNDADLSTDTNKAFRIVEEAIVAVTSIRGRLGTMQKATFESNINVLNDTLQSLTAAESQIRDTDFAEETANLTRAQILVQSNISTLGIANQIPNYMLGLLSR